MDNLTVVQEDIVADVSVLTKELPLTLLMRGPADADFSFHCSINPTGEVVLTPKCASVEFVQASIDNTNDSITEEQNSIIDTQVHVTITANIVSDTDNTATELYIDDIGQCIVCPVDPATTFVSVAVADSLDLVSVEEELSQEETDALEQAVENTTAEVLTEDSTDIDEVEYIVGKITSSFTEEDGAIKTDTHEEADSCEVVLQEYYNDVTITDCDTYFIIRYRGLKHAGEEKTNI